MKVLKFGGTSVGSAESINKVISIIDAESQSDNITVVVSAIGGVTNKLVKVAELACDGDESYRRYFDEIAQIHHQIEDQLFIDGDKNLDSVRLSTTTLLDELKQLLDGIFLINEISPKTSDKLLSFGELLSSTIIYHALKSDGRDIILKNGQVIA
jgi:aspartokinase/homoserine dehydrogenase 1